MIKKHGPTEDRHFSGSFRVAPGAQVPILRARPFRATGSTVYCHVTSWQKTDEQEESPFENSVLKLIVRKYSGEAYTEDIIDLPVRGWRGHVSCDEVELLITLAADSEAFSSTIIYQMAGGIYDGDDPNEIQHIDFTGDDFDEDLLAGCKQVVLQKYSHEARCYGEGAIVFLGPDGDGVEAWLNVAAYHDWTPLHRRAYRIYYVPRDGEGGADYCRVEVR